MKKITLPLPCGLNDAEIKDLALKHIEHEEQMTRLKTESKAVADSYKDRIAGHKADAERLSEEIKKQTREKDVACAEITQTAVGDVVTIRLDTGAEVSRRRITDEERQGNLLEDETEEASPEERSEETRIAGLFELADLLKEAGMTLGRNLQPLWNLKDEQVLEARQWVIQKKAATEGVEAPPPTWLTELEAESQEAVKSEQDFQVRVNTIKVLLAEQEIPVDEAEIGMWKKEDQDAVIAWTDSLGSDQPLRRPSFLDKFSTAKEEESTETSTETPDEAAPRIIHQLAMTEIAPDSHESRPVCDPTLTEFEVDTNAPVNCGACFAKQAKSNGQLEISTEDLQAKLNDLGAEVALERVQGWGPKELEAAKTWATETQHAIDSDGERKPAPDFFFS